MQCGASAIWAPRTASYIGEGGKDKSWSIEYMQKANKWAKIHKKHKMIMMQVMFASFW